VTETELFEMLDVEHHVRVRGWLDRGCGVAVYRDAEQGHRQFVSFGNPRAQLECGADDLPTTLNGRYQLEGTMLRRDSA